MRLFVELHRDAGSAGSGGNGEPRSPPEPFSLRTAFPRRLFTEEDMEKPLQELGEGFGGSWGGLGGPAGDLGVPGRFRRRLGGSLRRFKRVPRGLRGFWGGREGVWGFRRGLWGGLSLFEGFPENLGSPGWFWGDLGLSGGTFVGF